jgi:peptide deformylase
MQPILRGLSKAGSSQLYRRHTRNGLGFRSCSVSVGASDVLLLGATELRATCSPVGADDLREEKSRLQQTLEHFRCTNGFGRGIAAPQIGITRRLIALNLGEGPFTLSDPQITWKSDKRISLWDDCMSLPWILCKVERHASISIRYTDDNGKIQQWEKIPTAESELLQHGTAP